MNIDKNLIKHWAKLFESEDARMNGEESFLEEESHPIPMPSEPKQYGDVDLSHLYEKYAKYIPEPLGCPREALLVFDDNMNAYGNGNVFGLLVWQAGWDKVNADIKEIYNSMMARQTNGKWRDEDTQKAFYYTESDSRAQEKLLQDLTPELTNPKLKDAVMSLFKSYQMKSDDGTRIFCPIERAKFIFLVQAEGYGVVTFAYTDEKQIVSEYHRLSDEHPTNT